MADPVVYDSQVSAFRITDTGGVERDVTDYVVAVEGLPGTRELAEATTLNRSGRHFHDSLENVAFTVDLVYSEDSLVGTDTVFGPLRSHTAAVAFEYYPIGTGGIKYYGNCWVRDYRIITRIGDIVRARAECQVQGTVSRTS